MLDKIEKVFYNVCLMVYYLSLIRVYKFLQPYSTCFFLFRGNNSNQRVDSFLFEPILNANNK